MAAFQAPLANPISTVLPPFAFAAVLPAERFGTFPRMSVLGRREARRRLAKREGIAVDKKSLSERDICTKFITPAVAAAGWDNRCLLIALTEPYLLERASELAIGSTVKHLRVGDVERLAIPLPPLAKQRRIVAKVTDLLAVCDQLKARIASARAKHAQLAEALVEAAVS